ncbi:MAG: phage protein GemA/Gp16 family protein [Arenicellales bacterium]
MPADGRQRLYKLLAVGKRQLHWDEDFYRSILYSHGAKQDDDGKFSAKMMNIVQLEAVLYHMRQCGFVPRRNNKPKKISEWRKPMIAKLNAMWIALADAGVVHNRSEAALTKFCYQHTKTAKLGWAKKEGLIRSIEMLKSMAAREHVSLK